MPPKSKKNIAKKTSNLPKTERQLLEKDDDHEYALVTKKLGNGRFAIKLHLRENEIIGRVCGKFRAKRNKRTNWVEVGGIVLVGLRDFQDNVADIVYIYNPAEIRALKKSGAIVFDDVMTVDGPTGDEPIVEEAFDFNDI